MTAEDKAHPAAVTFGRPATVRIVGAYCLMETHHLRNYDLPRHDHAQASINIVLSGGFDERIGRRDLVNRPGTMVAKPAGAHHSNRYGSGPTVSLLIHPVADVLSSLGTAARAFGRVRVREGARHLEFARSVVTALRVEGEDASIECALDAMIVELAGLTAPSTRSTGVPSWLSRMRDELLSDASPPLSIGAMARREGIPLPTVAKAFRRVYGRSASAFAREARVNQVKRLLAEGRPVTEVAYLAAFADQAHLTRFFKQETALTPGQYRRQLR